MPFYCIIASAARLPRAHRDPPQTGRNTLVYWFEDGVKSHTFFTCKKKRTESALFSQMCT
ncbi:hypothetical protein NBRC111894_3197 [Sporolactobacillus inulinus]|uniref:Uncharacterized protein n=1 Tax=Sporolactobacillus inulinus TaxID=2078 RepID=A0A4Y1ZF69_9BACL|nr:hypothetical protein NBRC111894_3197 [Sporolactobacillus inulinus]